jgi:recombinational DNA repair ATPase RecF
MQIATITIRNFLGIKTFKITQAGKMNLITGDNGVGKSTVIKAIREAFKGSGIKPELIRNGADKAEILIQLDSGLCIERTLTGTSNNVKVVSPDGAPISKPQTFLKALLSGHNFNPVGFFQQKPAERRAQFLSSVPFTLDPDTVTEAAGDLSPLLDINSIDFTGHGLDVLAAIAQQVYDKRREQGLQVTQLDKSIKQERKELSDTTGVERFEAFNYQGALKDLQAAEAQIAAHGEKVVELDGLREQGARMLESIKEREERLAALKQHFSEVQAQGKQLAAKVKAFNPPEVEQLRRDLSDYEQAQKVLSALDTIKHRESGLEAEADKHKMLDLLYGIIKNDLPRQALLGMKLPMEGLRIDGDNIMLGDVPIEMLSTSEQMRLAVQIAKALAGDLKLVCVDGYEALSPKTQKLFVAEAGPDDGFEYFIARVGDGELRHEILGADPA